MNDLTIAKLILKIENCFVTSHYNIVRRGIYMCAYLIITMKEIQDRIFRSFVMAYWLEARVLP